MTPRILITLAIIAAIGIGTGAMVFGTLEIIDVANENVSAIIAVGSILTTGGFAALIAHMAGAFRILIKIASRYSCATIESLKAKAA